MTEAYWTLPCKAVLLVYDEQKKADRVDDKQVTRIKDGSAVVTTHLNRLYSIIKHIVVL